MKRDEGGAYRDVRAVVLGASGFIGRWVAHALGARGARLSLVVRDATAAASVFSRYGTIAPGNRGDVYECDLRESGSLQALFEAIRPAVTFNLAGYGVDRAERDAETTYLLNAGLLDQLGEAIAGRQDGAWPGQHLVHVGSALEYGSSGGNLDETSQPHATTLYGKSKLAGTLAVARGCSARGIRGLTARLFTVYGPGEHAGRLLPSLVEAARSGEALRLTAGEQKRDFTYIGDVAEGLLRLGLAQVAPGAIINLATGRLTRVRDFVETAAGILRIPGDRLQFGALPTRAEEMEHAQVTIERLRRSVAWVPPTDIADGIRRTLRFNREHGKGEIRPTQSGGKEADEEQDR